MRRRLVQLVVLAAIGGGCGVSAQQAAQEIAPPWCSKLQSCFPAQFDAEYNGPQVDCIGQNELASPSTNGCSSAQLDKCVSDINKATCTSTFDSMSLPSSCNPCDGKL
jgi:hypothetical protein